MLQTQRSNPTLRSDSKRKERPLFLLPRNVEVPTGPSDGLRPGYSLDLGNPESTSQSPWYQPLHHAWCIRVGKIERVRCIMVGWSGWLLDVDAGTNDRFDGMPSSLPVLNGCTYTLMACTSGASDSIFQGFRSRLSFYFAVFDCPTARLVSSKRLGWYGVAPSLFPSNIALFCAARPDRRVYG